MARRNAKAELILSDAEKRLKWAQARVADAEAQLGIANAALSAHQRNYDALVAALAPTPRKATKKAEKPSASPPAQKEPTPGKEVKCGVCYEVEDHSNHDATYISSH